MCSRYHVDDGMFDEIRETVSVIERNALTCLGDIRPSDNAPVIDGATLELRLGIMRWGFPKSDGKGLLINARSETAAQKPAFREGLLNRRCVIPASQFYEWDRTKRRVVFSCPDSPLLCFAGLYRVKSDGPRFVILTTEANESVLPVHSRMPLLIERHQITGWIYDSRQAQSILRQKMPVINRKFVSEKSQNPQLYLFPDVIE